MSGKYYRQAMALMARRLRENGYTETADAIMHTTATLKREAKQQGQDTSGWEDDER